MKALMGVMLVLALLSIGAFAEAQDAVFFEEQFDGPTLDPAAWRTEMLTSGPRFCLDTTEPWSPGHWVDEGVACHGVAAYSPYGSAILSDGLLHMSSSNVRAFPVLLSRLPGSSPLFPPSGDFTLKVRMRYDRVTPWGTGIQVFQTQSTEPSGSNSLATPQNVLLHIWCDDPGGGIDVFTAIGGSLVQVADVSPATEFHLFELDCAGNMLAIRVDGQIVFGPAGSDMMPTAAVMGNAAVAFWYPTDWTSFSVDYVRVGVPAPPTGACCLCNDCTITTMEDCAAQGGFYMGDGTTCDPNLCSSPPIGACCVEYVCTIEYSWTCEEMGGTYYGDCSDCDPTPCPPPTPVEDSSWGRIKSRFH
jgi:hypothetical protein